MKPKLVIYSLKSKVNTILWRRAKETVYKRTRANTVKKKNLLIMLKRTKFLLQNKAVKRYRAVKRNKAVKRNNYIK